MIACFALINWWNKQVNQPIEPQKSFVIAYQEKNLEKETLERLRKCETLAQLNPILGQIDYEAKQFDKNTIFIFSKNSKLDNYIIQKQKLMDYFVQEQVGAVSKPWNSVHYSKELPEFWQKEVDIMAKSTSNTKVHGDGPIVPVLYCRVTLKFEEREVSTLISMARDIPENIFAKLRNLAFVEGGVVNAEKRLPATLEEAVAQFPYVSFTLNGLITKTWGYPLYNSQAAKVLEAYYKELSIRSESSEERLKRIYREFFKKLAAQDPMWSELEDLNGKPAKEMSKELSTIVERHLAGDPGHRFLNDQDLTRFLTQATIVKNSPVIEIYVPKLNHTGTFSFLGLVF